MFRLKFAGVLFVLFVFAGHALATAQFPDRIFYNGKDYKLHTSPMNEYFRKFPEKLPETGISSSALSRGYVAEFEISGGELWLQDVQIQVRKTGSEKSFETEWKSILPGIAADRKKMKFDWFSGILILPYGNVRQYVHAGYATTYEHYILIEISKGDFRKAKDLTFEKFVDFRNKQFEAFKKTSDYKKRFDELKQNRAFTDELAESQLKNRILEYSSKFLVD